MSVVRVEEENTAISAKMSSDGNRSAKVLCIMSKHKLTVHKTMTVVH